MAWGPDEMNWDQRSIRWSEVTVEVAETNLRFLAVFVASFKAKLVVFRHINTASLDFDCLCLVGEHVFSIIIHGKITCIIHSQYLNSCLGTYYNPHVHGKKLHQISELQIFQVLELLRVFFCKDIFLDDLALRMALETQLDRHQRAEQTVELMASTLYCLVIRLSYF